MAEQKDDRVLPGRRFGPALNSVGIAQACSHSGIAACSCAIRASRGFSRATDSRSARSTSPSRWRQKRWPGTGRTSSTGTSRTSTGRPTSRSTTTSRNAGSDRRDLEVGGEGPAAGPRRARSGSRLHRQRRALPRREALRGAVGEDHFMQRERDCGPPTFPPTSRAAASTTGKASRSTAIASTRSSCPSTTTSTPSSGNAGEAPYSVGEFFEASPHLNLLLYPEPVKYRRRHALDEKRFQYLKAACARTIPTRSRTSSRTTTTPSSTSASAPWDRGTPHC